MYDLILVLSLLASVSAVLIDKTVTRTASAWDCTVFGIFLQTALLVPFFVLWTWPGWKATALLFGAGLVTGSARILWYKALSREQLGRVAPFKRLSTVFVMLGAFWILKEKLTGQQIAGALVMIAGSFLLLGDKFSRSLGEFLHLNRYVGCVLYFALALAAWKVTYAFFASEAFLKPSDEGVRQVPRALCEASKPALVYTALFTMKLGQFAVVAPSMRRPRRVDGLWTLSVSQTLQLLSTVLFLFVISGQDLALSEPIAAASPLLLIILSRLILKERDPYFAKRLIAGAIMVIGYLVMKDGAPDGPPEPKKPCGD